jgi:hypothetical protein
MHAFSTSGKKQSLATPGGDFSRTLKRFMNVTVVVCPDLSTGIVLVELLKRPMNYQC